VWAGNAQIPIRGYGEVDIRVNSPQGPLIMRLYDVAYCEGLACNLVSFRLLRRKGYYWNNRGTCNELRRKDGSIVCFLTDEHNQTVLESIPAQFSKQAFYARRNTFNSWTERAPSSASDEMWHLRLGHPGAEALRHFQGHSRGVRVKRAITTVECDACACAKAKQQISREPRDPVLKAGTRLAIDFHDFEEDIDGYSNLMLVTDRYSGFIWDLYLKDRKAATIIEALEMLFGILRTQYQVVPEVIECDNEIVGQKPKVKDFLEQPPRSIRLEPSAPYTQSQNGGAERSGGVIKNKARAMRLGSNLPPFLWVEIYRCAVYLYNRIPKYMYNWKSPYERFYAYLSQRDGFPARDHRPKQAHLRVFGCKAFVMTTNAKVKKDRLKRLEPRAWIGFLVGYNSTNIYRIWNPSTNRIVATRDVTFNEKDLFKGNLDDLSIDIRIRTKDEWEDWLNSLEVSQSQSATNDASSQEEDEELSSIAENESVGQGVEFAAVSDQQAQARDGATGDHEVHRDGSSGDHEVHPEGVSKGNAALESDQLYLDAAFAPYLTPEPTPPPPAALLAAAIRESAPEQYVRAAFSATTVSVEAERSTPRSIKARHGPWEAAFNAGRLATPLGMTADGGKVSKARFSKLMNLPANRPGAKEQFYQQDYTHSVRQLRSGKSVHRRDMPPLPKAHRDLRNHPLAAEFKTAEKVHLQSHHETRSWREVPKSEGHGRQLLDSMWVYVYKFNKHGQFAKVKARLVIRGDQQNKSIHESTYASTLAGRSFRTLMAIAAKFDLELIQYDVVNAFVNAELKQDIYMRMPRGYVKPGVILKLQKALYGLRESPLLWQRHLTETLSRIGFTPVPHEPCCFAKNGVLLFFYVDDIVVAYQKDKKKEAESSINSIKAKYQLSGGGDLQWFLGIEIIRDRKRRLIWLSQSDYIDKISNLAPQTEGAAPLTPMTDKELLPSHEIASPASINRYQRKVGSILYAAVITRIDIAFAASRLARFNMNPGQEHHEAADRVLRYLRGTKYHALQLGGEGEDTFVVASDASFADNSIDRKSSQAYVMRLFGGTIGWRANKQDTVTTSTTEAELLALAQASKEALYISRLIKELGVSLDDKRITIQCDNQQTIRLVHEEVALLQTKLRHVDIHNHWLRQEVQNRTIKVKYTPTADMIADGLTKALPNAKHAVFVQQVGLVDVRDRVEARKLRELKEDDFDAVEDSLEGGEAGLIPEMVSQA
jgi:hypothetical protein